MTNTNHKTVDTINKLKKGILDAGGTKVNANNFKAEGAMGRIMDISFKSDGTVTVKHKGATVHSWSAQKQADLVEAVALIRGIAQIAKDKKAAAEAAQADMKSETKTKESKMTKAATYVSQSKITDALIKSGWSKDENGIMSHPSGMICKFNEKTVRLANDAVQINVPKMTTTDAQLVNYLKSVLKGEKPKMVKTEGLEAPADAATVETQELPGISENREQTPNGPEKGKGAKKGKKADEKPAEPPKKPVNPNADGATPIFDAVNNAIGETDKAENAIKGAWEPIAVQFGYSVSGLTAALHAEGRWPDKLDKKGNPIGVDGVTVPMGYKKVYDAEREAGTKGVGHMVNTASRMFARFNPELAQKREEAQKKAAEKKAEAAQGTADEKTADEIMMKMSKLAAKLSPEDLKSWLENDASTMPIIEEMRGEDTGATVDALAGLDDISLDLS